MTPSRPIRSFLLGSTLPLLALPALAQDAPTPRQTLLETVTIGDTRSEQTALDALTGLSVVDAAEIGRQQPGSTADVLRRVPGVGSTMSGDDTSVAVNIRGLQQMGRVVVTLDGARQDFWRVGHGSGSFYIEPDLLKQVTVIRGPASNSYGTGAIGGVVAFETKDARDVLRQGETWALSQKLRFGSNGERGSTVTTAAFKVSEALDVIASYSYRDSDEYKDGNGDIVRWTGERAASGFAKITFRPAEGHELKFGVTRQNYDDIITGSSGSTSATLSRYAADTVVDTYTASWNYRPVGNDLIDLTLNLSRASTDNLQTQVWPAAAVGNTRYYDVATRSVSLQNVARFSGGGWDQTLTFGLDGNRMTGASDADHFGGGRQTTRGAFVQWQGRSGAFELIASARYDSYNLAGRTKATDVLPEQDVDISGNRLSPRLSLAMDVAQGVQLFAGYSEGYRTPHLQEMFRKNGSHGSGYEPNLLLRPEVAKSWEVGANIRRDGLLNAHDSLRAKVTLFDTKVDDYIDTTRVGTVTRYDNVGRARLKGIEIEGNYDFGRGYVALASSLVSAKMVSGANQGLTLSNTPLDTTTARIGLRAFDNRLEYGLEYQHLGDVDRITGTIRTYHPKVDLFNVFASWSFDDSTRLDFGVENLLDKAYTDPQSGWATSSDVHQGRGRTLRVALTKRFGG